MRTTFTPTCRLMQKVIKLVQSITLDLHSLCSISQLSNVNRRTCRKIHRTRQQTSVDQFLKNRIFDIERSFCCPILKKKKSYVLSTFRISDLFLLLLFLPQILCRRTTLWLNDESNILEFDRSICECSNQFRSHCKSVKKTTRSFVSISQIQWCFIWKKVHRNKNSRARETNRFFATEHFKFIRR